VNWSRTKKKYKDTVTMFQNWAGHQTIFFMRSRDQWKIVSTSKVPSAHASGEKGLWEFYRIRGGARNKKKRI